jgi:hypothetical protein
MKGIWTMGTYFNPADELPEVARPMQGCNFTELKAQLSPNERLFGLYDRGVFRIAVEIYNQAEFDEFYGQYRAGLFLDYNYYALPEDIYKERCD